MKAAVLEDLKRLSLQSVDNPVLDDDSIILRVRACAVCGSDIRIYNHGNPRVKPPQIMGHEIAGDVVAVGANVTRFAVGDRVAVGADVPCGACRPCESGLGNNCRTNLAMGYQFPGGFAEYVRLERRVVNFGPVHHIPEGMDYDTASLAEPLACAINGYELTGLKPMETVVVIGVGPIGAMLVELGRRMGAGKVIVVQRSRARLELARRFGADGYICAMDEDPVARVLEMTDGDGADVIFTANSSIEAQEQAVQMLAFRGRLNLFGGLPAGTRTMHLDSNFIHYREAFITGSHGSVPRQHAQALDMLARGYLDGSQYITHRFGLDAIHEAFDVAGRHEALKVIINP